MLAEPPTDPRASDPAAIAASGPRAEGRREEYELLVEAIYEGYLLPYSEPRLLRPMAVPRLIRFVRRFMRTPRPTAPPPKAA